MGSRNEMARLVREELLTLIQPVTLLSVNPERSTGKITGRFRSSGMLFDYNIGGKTVSYKPVGGGRSARADAQAALLELANAWEVVAELEQSRQDTRCQKPDGTIYGTAGKCKQGRELKADPKPSAKQRYKELSSRLRAGNNPDESGAFDKRNAAGARRALGNMIEKRGAAAPAAAKPKRKRRKSKSQSKANKPSMKTGRQAQSDPTLNQMRGMSAKDKYKLLVAQNKFAKQYGWSPAYRDTTGKNSTPKAAEKRLQRMISSRGRLDSYNAGYQEVMARLDWEG